MSVLRMRGVVLLAAVAAAFVGCETEQKSSESGLADGVEDLRITTSDIQGWSDTTQGSFDGDSVFIGDLLCGAGNPIDGACIPYTNRNVRETLIQLLTAPGTPYPLLLDAYAMDFGTAEGARVMFEDKKTELSATESMAGYADTVVVVKVEPYGCIVLAHFSKFYIELHFANYAQATESVDDAKMFMDIYYRKING